jgi:hypothetical protein
MESIVSKSGYNMYILLTGRVLSLVILLALISVPAQAAAGDMILNTSITLTFSDYRDGWENARNVTMIGEGYSLFLDDVWVHDKRIANFSIHKNGEVVRNSNVKDGDVLYYNKTIDGKEYKIIEAKVDGIFVNSHVVVRLSPLYQYSDREPAIIPEVKTTVRSLSSGVSIIEEWNRTLGKTNWTSEAYSVKKTSDGGFIIAGYIGYYGENAWIIKTDANGSEQWNTIFGIINISDPSDIAYSGNQTEDGGYIAAGRTYALTAGYSDFWLIKTDADGHEQWNKRLGGKYYDMAFTAEQTSDGGYVMAGGTDSYGAGSQDALLFKTDSNGNEQWNKTFGGKNFDEVSSIIESDDGGFILAGKTGSNSVGYYDAWIIKVDENGNESWNRTFGGAEGNHAYADAANSIQKTEDGGYVLAGKTGSYGAGFFDAWLIKTDKDGIEQWNRTFGGKGDDEAYSVQQTPDGGYVIAGTTDSYGEGNDAWIIKTDENGNEEWNRTFGGSGYDVFRSVIPESDGNYILAGGTVLNETMGYYAWLVKVKSTRSGVEPSEFITSDFYGSREVASDIKKSPSKSIPGFEISLTILSVIIVLLLKRKIS